MLYKAEALSSYTLMSREENIGKIKDVYFDDRFWTVRYLVADTGGWLTGRSVLISPYAVVSIDEAAETITTNLTTRQVEEAPSPEADAPVSRQFEMAYHDYYGWPYYWYGPYAWGGYVAPMPSAEKVSQEERDSWDAHLRSAWEVRGYRVGASDGDIGHVSDLLLDGDQWAFRYLIIDTRNWWPGKHVLFSPHWVESVDWPSRTVNVETDKETIKGAPEYDEEAPISRDYEENLHSYYSKEGYWY